MVCEDGALAHLGTWQRGVHYSGFKIFNSRPFNITDFPDNPRTFKSPLKIYIYELLLFIR